MATITAQEVNKLRQMTGAGMMDCKKALSEADGDFEKAIDILRKKGQKVSASRADRETTEGAVFTQIKADGKEGLLVALGCETDFVAKNDDFQAMGSSLLSLASSNGVQDSEALLSKAMSDGRSVNEHITELVGKIGEKIEVVAYERMSGDQVVTYIHSNGKLGVILSLEGASGAKVEEVGKDICMQIAAMNPVAVDKDQVDAAAIERELEVGREQARAEGKPDAMIEKIAQGKLGKFFKENTLLSQPFVKDNSKTIEALLKETDPSLKVKAFRRVQIG